MQEFLPLRVSVPRNDAPRLYSFRPEITVGEAARAVGTVFGYHVDQTFTFQRSNGMVLSSKERLEDSGFDDREQVELIWVGLET